MSHRNDKDYLPYFKRIALLHVATDILVLVFVGLIFFAPLFTTGVGSLLSLEYSLWDNVSIFLDAISLVGSDIISFAFVLEIIIILMYLLAVIGAVVNAVRNIIYLNDIPRYVSEFYQKLDKENSGRSPAPAVACELAAIFTFIMIEVIKFDPSVMGSTIFFGNSFNTPILTVLTVIFLVMIVLTSACRIFNQRVEKTGFIDGYFKIYDLTKDDNRADEENPTEKAEITAEDVSEPTDEQNTPSDGNNCQ